MRLCLSLAHSFDSARRPVMERQKLGLFLALPAYSLLSWRDAAVKWLVATVPVWQVLCVRSAILVLGSLGIGGRPLLRYAATTRSRALLIQLGTVTLAAWICYFTAARFLPLGQRVTLYFTAPVIVTILTAPFLGEQVGWVRWLAVGIGFLGTLLAANPVGLALSPATLLVLVAACLCGYGVILTRGIARQELSLVQMFLTDGVFLGLTALVWAFLLGFLVWGGVPGPGVCAGAVLILAAGLLLVVTEQRRRKNTSANAVDETAASEADRTRATGGPVGPFGMLWLPGSRSQV